MTHTERSIQFAVTIEKARAALLTHAAMSGAPLPEFVQAAYDALQAATESFPPMLSDEVEARLTGGEA